MGKKGDMKDGFLFYRLPNWVDIVLHDVPYVS